MFFNEKKGKITFKIRQRCDCRCIQTVDVDVGEKTFIECFSQAKEQFDMDLYDKRKHAITYNVAKW
jgi:hypothetical protein